MFRFEPDIQHLSLDRSSLAWLAESCNQPNVAVPGHQAQAAQGIVLAVEAGGGLTCQVAIWLTGTRRLAIFTHPDTMSPDELPRAIDEAQLFCESMGFILEPMPLESAEVDRVLARLAGHDDSPAEPAIIEVVPPPETTPAASTPGPCPEELARLGRLLSSF